MTRLLLSPSYLLSVLAVLTVGCTDKGSTDDTAPSSDQDADGYTASEGDCDDSDATVNPAAAEVWYDGVDQNCDGANDNDQDGDTVEVDSDCDDTNAAINPDASEVCDGSDNNCDGVVDEGSGVLGWADMDNDGYGDATAPVTTCGGDDPLIVDNDDDCDDANADIHPGAVEDCADTFDKNCDGSFGTTDNDGDGVLACEECDDREASVYPGAPEVCDFLDNDCDGSVDVDATDATSWYADQDGDGYGAEDDVLAACEQPEGYAPFDGDCDDTNAAYNPGIVEDCSSTEDLNCDGSLAYEDADSDGFVACEECDDADPSVFPGGVEVCDGADNDCNGLPDDDATDASTFYADADGDHYGSEALPVEGCTVPSGYVENADDCDDDAFAINPDAYDICDRVDNDCDSMVDGDASYYSTYYADLDSDLYGDPTNVLTQCFADAGYVTDSRDCDDSDSLINPDGTESCDGADNDCDGTVDLGAVDETAWYVDGDSDGAGAGAATMACDAPVGSSATDDDCDDGDNSAFPGALETCDEVDNDCNGLVDDSAIDVGTYYLDADGDTFGDLAVSVSVCGDAPAGYVSDGTDCDDDSSAAHPGLTETCDGLDNDCDGSTDEFGAAGESTFYADSDGDTYGDVSSTISACSAPAGYVSETTDCDDSASTVNPGAAETDNLVDDDCDKWVDEDFVSSGDIIVTEITRQAYVGGTSTNSDGQWFEVYNTSSRTVDLSYWYILRTSGATSVDAYFVDPADGVTVAPGDYAVFCKTDNYEAGSGVSYPLACDYIWGDETQSGTYSGTYHDNTFNLQRDLDRLAMYVEGGSSTGRLIDDVTWTYSSTSGYWPRDATRSMSLDPAFLDGSSNNSLANWCSTTNSATYQWWDGTYDDYGSPGGANYNCP